MCTNARDGTAGMLLAVAFNQLIVSSITQPLKQQCKGQACHK